MKTKRLVLAGLAIGLVAIGIVWALRPIDGPWMQHIYNTVLKWDSALLVAVVTASGLVTLALLLSEAKSNARLLWAYGRTMLIGASVPAFVLTGGMYVVYVVNTSLGFSWPETLLSAGFSALVAGIIIAALVGLTTTAMLVGAGLVHKLGRLVHHETAHEHCAHSTPVRAH